MSDINFVNALFALACGCLFIMLIDFLWALRGLIKEIHSLTEKMDNAQKMADKTETETDNHFMSEDHDIFN